MNNKPVKNNSSKAAGFTLLELIVAAGIFVVIVTITTGFYSRFVNTQRRDIAEQQLLEEIRSALEIFNREARTGYGNTFMLAAPDKIGTGSIGEGIIFRNQNGDCVEYFLNANRQLVRGEGRAAPRGCEPESIAPNSITPLTSSAVTFNRLLFVPTAAQVNNSGGLTSQGFITVALQAAINNPTVPPIEIQSTVTSRQVTPYQKP